MKIPRLLTLFLILPLIARADQDDNERARQALERGEARPLRAILESVEQELDGRIVEIEFEVRDGRYVYEFEYIAPDGRLLEALVDAKSGRVLSIAEEED